MKLTSNQLSPNLLLKDALYALLQLPFVRSKKQLSFEHIFGTKNYTLLNSARSGLGLIIDIVQPDKTKKIGLPAFLCGVVATPFLQRQYQIEWIDTDTNGLLDPKDFEKKASQLSLLVVPHIFGQNTDMQSIQSIAKQYNIFVVKDGAHHLDTDLSDCDALILSFGREKVMSCVSGGALLWSGSNEYFHEYQKQTHNLPLPSVHWTLKHLFHPLWFSVSLPFWNIWNIPLGKLFIHIVRKLKLLPLAVSSVEKQGYEDLPIQTLPYSQQKLLLKQWQQYEDQQRHQAVIAKHWEESLQQLFPENKIIVPDSHFRVIMLCKDQSERQSILTKTQQHNIRLQDWDGVPISPHGVDLHAFQYERGQCPNAETYAQHQLTFPTNKRTHLKDIERFSKLFQA